MKQYKLIENNIIHDITEFPNSNKYWRLNGKRHRTDGPAVEWNNGSKEWYRNGLLHRVDGPAIEYYKGDKYYYYNGKLLENINSNEELQRYIKLLSIS